MDKIYTFKLPVLDKQTGMQDQPEATPAKDAGINRVTTATSRLFVSDTESVFIFDFNNLVDWPKFVSTLLMRWRSSLCFMLETESLDNVTGGAVSDQTFSMYKVAMLDNGELAPQNQQVVRRVVFVINKDDDKAFKRAFTETLIATDPNLMPEWTSYINETPNSTLEVNTTAGTLDKISTSEPVARGK